MQIVTGANGFIGKHLCRRQLPEALYHLEAITDTTLTNRFEMFRVNTVEPLAMFQRAIDEGCKRIVYASSCAVYGDGATPFKEDQPLKPLNVYAESKAVLDQQAMKLADRTGVKIVGLRFSNVYGSGERHKGKSASMVSRIAWQMQEGNPKLFHDGYQVRDWVYVEDVIDAMLLAPNWPSGVYNIASGVSTSFNELVSIWNDALGLSRQPEYIDNPHTGKYQSRTEVDISKVRSGGYCPQYTIHKGIHAYKDNL